MTSTPVPAKSIKFSANQTPIPADKKDSTEAKKVVKVLKKAVKDIPPEHKEIEYPNDKDKT